MESFITSYLIQQRQCSLPRFGNFTIRQIPALLDVANKKIYPATDEISFAENESELSPGLQHYLTQQLNISEPEAEKEIISWCTSAKMKIDDGEKIEFPTIGHLQRNEAGNLIFQRGTELNLFQPIAAERVVHKNAEHAVLVGDKETTSAAMNEFFREDDTSKNRSPWKIRALVLLAIAILLLILFYSSHSFSIAARDGRSLLPLATYLSALPLLPAFIF